MRELLDKLGEHVDAAIGDPSRSTVGRIGDDVTDLKSTAHRLEVERATDPIAQLADSLSKAMQRGGGQPPIGKGGVYGIVVAVCLAFIGSPVLDRMLPISQEFEAEHAAAAAVVDKRLDEIEIRLASVDRRFAAEQRTNAWVAEVLRKSLAATGKIAHKLEIQDVDLVMPVLWPE